MELLSLPTLVTAWALAFPLPGPPAPLPQLSKADAEWVNKKYAEALQFGRAGKWGPDEAQAPVRDILDRCTRELGKDHYQTADWRREIEGLKQLAALPAADGAEYQKTYVLYDEMAGLAKKGKYADAAKPAGQILDIYRRLLGRDSTYTAVAANQYGLLLDRAARYDEAREQYAEALRIRRRVLGESHPSTGISYVNLGAALDYAGRPADAQHFLRKAVDIFLAVEGEDGSRLASARDSLALSLSHQGKDAEAEPLFQTVIAARVRVLGEGHPDTALARNNLASLYDRQARYADAGDLFGKALDALLAAEGEDGPHVAMARNNLASNLTTRGRCAEAEGLYRKAIDAQRKANPDHPDFALFCTNLANNLDAQARHAAAEVLHRQALELMSRVHGPAHLKTATVYSNLAVNLDYQGRSVEAEDYLDKALAIFLAAPKGDATLRAAGAYSNLASCLHGQDRDEDARAAAEKALAIYGDLLPADHPLVVTARTNLAASLSAQGKDSDAEEQLRTVLAAFRGKLGEDHAATAEAHNNLGVNLYNLGRFAAGDPHLWSALYSFRRTLGEAHPRTAGAYKSLIGNACARGDYARADALADAATASFEAARLRLGSAGLDRSLRTADISPLPGLAVAAARRGRAVAAWEALERNLARGLLDDLAARPRSPADRERELAQLGNLSLLDQRIDVLRNRGAGAVVDRQKAEAERDAAQAELVQFQNDLAARDGATAGRVYDLKAIQKQLPDGSALVTWLDLPAVPNWWDRKGDHWACVVKQSGDPVWVQLAGGADGGAWTETDEQLADRVRACVREPHSKADWKDLVGKLAAQRLKPLETHLSGVHHLIVLPSVGMRRIPVEALTDRQPDLTVSYAPSGTMFAWLREKRVAGAKSPPKYLLALGNPAFKKGDDQPGSLPGALHEVAGISRPFDRCWEFKGPEASEQNLDKLAAEDGGLRRFPYIHFATHGVLDSQRPMRSALLLAQTELPDPLARVLDGKEAYDGRLTAERILRRWDRQLDAELVTLSACQTGLGKHAGGEGYLGFSQALFVAGARSLVVSLWEVDDTATGLLMTRFYENLMGLKSGVPGGPLEPRPKAEALAEAKRWLRELPADQVRELSDGLPRQGTRGRVAKGSPPAKAAESYEHPYYWSGFVLVGDPR